MHGKNIHIFCSYAMNFYNAIKMLIGFFKSNLFKVRFLIRSLSISR